VTAKKSGMVVTAKSNAPRKVNNRFEIVGMTFVDIAKMTRCKVLRSKGMISRVN
jgi:hypothetical protein